MLFVVVIVVVVVDILPDITLGVNMDTICCCVDTHKLKGVKMKVISEGDFNPPPCHDPGCFLPVNRQWLITPSGGRLYPASSLPTLFPGS